MSGSVVGWEQGSRALRRVLPQLPEHHASRGSLSIDRGINVVEFSVIY